MFYAGFYIILTGAAPAGVDNRPNSIPGRMNALNDHGSSEGEAVAIAKSDRGRTHVEGTLLGIFGIE